MIVLNAYPDLNPLSQFMTAFSQDSVRAAVHSDFFRQSTQVLIFENRKQANKKNINKT